MSKVFPRPELCISCTENLDTEEKALPCGHWVHKECIARQFKAECPICRHSLDIEVNGSHPSPYIPYGEHIDYDVSFYELILFGENIGVEQHTLEQISSLFAVEENEEENNYSEVEENSSSDSERDSHAGDSHAENEEEDSNAEDNNAENENNEEEDSHTEDSNAETENSFKRARLN